MLPIAIQLIASPHPLDFDWRFDASSISKLYNLSLSRNVLSLGAPSIARQIEANGGRILLVDRQPVQEVNNQLVADVSTLDLHGDDFDLAIVDPPWYPQHLVDWVSAAGRALSLGGEIIVSVWPAETRPEAADELSRCIDIFSGWANVKELPLELTYVPPPFEETAISISGNDPLARSPRHAHTLHLTIRHKPDQPIGEPRPPRWHRFFIDGYQIAVRLDSPAILQNLIVRHPEAKNWLWPYVSARAPGRDSIGIWSSAGEVGQIGNSKQLIASLQTALRSATVEAFKTALAAAPALIDWKIPRPPYERVLEWQHP